MLDKVEISVEGAKGGSGAASFPREKFIVNGGPDGGDGGRGGRVFLQAVDDIYTLETFRAKKAFRADNGLDGGIRQRTGARGSDLTLSVPVGTRVYDVSDGTLLADLVSLGETALVALGGRGGWGNRRFATSTNQAPRYAQKGHSGEKSVILLDLNLLADVGLIGLPNAGKSTFLSVVSQAKPKVAAYPFTTLAPVLGVVSSMPERFTIADLPGLVEGAHQGVGLGLEFLKHVQRCRVLVHLVDGNEPEPLESLGLIENEVRAYDPSLSELESLIIVTKADIDPAACERVAGQLKEQGRNFVSVISSLAEEGLDESVKLIYEAVVRARKEEREREARKIPVIRPPATERFRVERKGTGKFEVIGAGPVSFVEMMNLEEDDSREEVFRRLERWGVTKELVNNGVDIGDTGRFGESSLIWE